MTQLLLIRHGQTDWNLARRYQGQTDIPLNPTGISQAEELANKLQKGQFDAIYSSDLSRAKQTAQIVSEKLGIPVTTDPRLREICKGIWEGMSFDEVKEKYAVALSQDNADPANSRTPGGETVAEVAARMAASADDISMQHPQGSVLVVSHGLAVSTLYCQANKVPLSKVYQFIPENAVPIKIEW